jgi:hypothetical protein
MKIGRLSMDRVLRPLFAHLLVFAFAYGGSTNGQSTQWKGKFETVDGLKVIRNPNAPLFGDLKLDLREDLQIGQEGVENYYFERIVDIKIADDGSIYVLDGKAAKIQRFDKDGKHIQTIGKKGQGPGEFQWPFNICIHPQSHLIYVQDSLQSKIFDPSGNFIKAALLRDFPSSFSVDNDGNFWIIARRLSERGEFKILEKTGPGGELLAAILEVPYRSYTMSSGARDVIAVAAGYESDLYFTRTASDLIIYGYSDSYDLTAMDAKGKPHFKIAKEEARQSIGSDEIKGPVTGKLPKTKPFYYSLFSDDTGRIYALKANPATFAKSDVPKPFDVFGRDGVFLYRLELPYSHVFCIKNGYLYARHVIEDSGLEVVKRFKIGNWEKIKNSAN